MDSRMDLHQLFERSVGFSRVFFDECLTQPGRAGVEGEVKDHASGIGWPLLVGLHSTLS